jgi:hypothetical protein
VVSGGSQIPLVLRLLQVTNLAPAPARSAKPIAASIDGNRVTFESISSSQRHAHEGGNHWFRVAKVRLDFTRPLNWPKIWSSAVAGARDELLTIHVRGTLRNQGEHTASHADDDRRRGIQGQRPREPAPKGKTLSRVLRDTALNEFARARAV